VVVCEDACVTGVYLEIGKRKVFACARDWPGWARAGRGEDAAPVALEAAAPRFAVVCARAGMPFDGPSAVAHFEIVERVAGSATTDFGALDVCAGLEREPLTRQDAGRLAALVEAAWNVFGQAASAAPPALRKGPRGGGRDRDAIVDHVLQTEVLHARMLGLPHRPFPPGDTAAAARVRADILAAILAGEAPGQPRSRAWHATSAFRRAPYRLARARPCLGDRGPARPGLTRNARSCREPRPPTSARRVESLAAGV